MYELTHFDTSKRANKPPASVATCFTYSNCGQNNFNFVIHCILFFTRREIPGLSNTDKEKYKRPAILLWPVVIVKIKLKYMRPFLLLVLCAQANSDDDAY